MSFGDRGCCGTLSIEPIYSAAPVGGVSSFKKDAQVENRFETFPDPFNNWIVWDLKKDNVAEVGSQILVFLTEARARELCTVLNRQETKIAA